MLNLNWYSALNHPPLTPPSWVFPPAWAGLYTMIFISFVLFALKRTEHSKISGFVLFFVQLLLNFIWPSIFFYFKNISMAFWVLILLDFAVLLTLIEFYKISKKSAYFLIPYFIWILFATYLNFGFLVLN